MDVSIWWVIAASFLGVWTGILVTALLGMAKDGEEGQQRAPRIASVRSYG